MKYCITFLALCLFSCASAGAQEYPRAEVYGGYQLLVDEDLIDDITYAQGLDVDAYDRQHGINAAVEYNIRKWMGIVAEAGHGRSSLSLGDSKEGVPIWSARYRRNQTSFLFGPRFGYREGRMRAFGHLLFGGNRANHSYTFTVTNELGFQSGYAASFSGTDVAMALGGGLDISLGDRISIRPVQLDLLSIFADDSLHQFRYSAGLVFKLGSAKR
jgi:hypothetical protein